MTVRMETGVGEKGEENRGREDREEDGTWRRPNVAETEEQDHELVARFPDGLKWRLEDEDEDEDDEYIWKDEVRRIGLLRLRMRRG